MLYWQHGKPERIKAVYLPTIGGANPPDERKEGDANVCYISGLGSDWNIHCSPCKPALSDMIEAAKATAGVKEETNTWSGWKKLGYEVIHGSKALFGADLIRAAEVMGLFIRLDFLENPRYRKSQCNLLYEQTNKSS